MRKRSFKAVRESLRLTQIEMSLKAKVSHSTIQKFEAGVLRPGFKIAERLSRGYEIPVEEIESACGIKRGTAAA